MSSFTTPVSATARGPPTPWTRAASIAMHPTHVSDGVGGAGGRGGVGDGVARMSAPPPPPPAGAFHIPSDRVSHLLPRVFEERVVRVYSRSRDERKWKAIQRAFRRHISQFT